MMVEPASAQTSNQDRRTPNKSRANTTRRPGIFSRFFEQRQNINQQRAQAAAAARQQSSSSEEVKKAAADFRSTNQKDLDKIAESITKDPKLVQQGSELLNQAGGSDSVRKAAAALDKSIGSGTVDSALGAAAEAIGAKPAASQQRVVSVSALPEPSAKPVTSTAKPIAKPITSTARPVARPITSTARPVARPITSTARPVAKPITSTPARQSTTVASQRQQLPSTSQTTWFPPAQPSAGLPGNLLPIQGNSIPAPKDPIRGGFDDRPKRDPKTTTRITADRADFDQNTSVVVFEDNVILKHPEFDLNCSVLVAYLSNSEAAEDDSQQAETAISQASAGGIDRAVATGYVVIEKLAPDGSHQVAHSRRAEYERATGIVILSDRPVLQDSKNLIEGAEASTRIILRPDGKYTVNGKHTTEFLTPANSLKLPE